jgi:hypothetical protein
MATPIFTYKESNRLIDHILFKVVRAFTEAMPCPSPRELLRHRRSSDREPGQRAKRPGFGLPLGPNYGLYTFHRYP